MRAAWYEKYGPAREVFQVGSLDTPEPGPGEVRVRLYASGANPSDYKARLGSRGPMRWPRVVPHSDGAGVIDLVGEGVDRRREGERVWVYNGQWERPMGTTAEYIVLPEELAVRLPEGVGFEEGACLGIPGMTAHRGLFADGPITGRTVLVTGGAGAVGRCAVQLGKWGGARVITTVSGEKKAEVAHSAGADHIVNYRGEDVAARIMEITGGAGVDRIVDVDFGENLPVTKKVLKLNGVVAAYGSTRVREPVLPWYEMMGRNYTIRMIMVYSMPVEARRAACADVVRACEEKALNLHVGAVFPLVEVAAAHETMEKFANLGNVVVQIG